jgi:DNA-binding response OmpR family regulator
VLIVEVKTICHQGPKFNLEAGGIAPALRGMAQRRSRSLARLRRHDVILLDVMLPGCDGFSGSNSCANATIAHPS